MSKNFEGARGACVRRRGRLQCHGTMAQWPVQVCWGGPVPPPQKHFFLFWLSIWWVLVHSGWYFLQFSYLFYTQNRYRRVKAVMVSRWDSARGLGHCIRFEQKARLDQNVFVYRLTFRWPKSDCDVDVLPSKYYLLLALVCW